MEDVKAVEEGAELPDKRKLDLSNSVSKAPEEEIDSNKRPKVEISPEKNGSVPLSSYEKVEKSGEHDGIDAAAEEDNVEDEEDYNAEQDEDEDKKAKIFHRKGKGAVVDGKGKGKMVEDVEDEDSDGEDNDNDDESSDDSDSDFLDGLDDSDIEDDPLAEVDLNNILPSRTRQRQMQAGVRIIREPAKGKDASMETFSA